MNREEVTRILRVIDKLLGIKNILRKITPTYKLEGQNEIELIELLEEIKKDLDPLFQKYISIEKKSENEKKTREFKKLINRLNNKSNQILVSSKSTGNLLKNMGFKPSNIIVSGGPLNIKDYKELNPSLGDRALDSIKKKIQTLITKIQNIDWNSRDLIFIFEKTNKSDQLILKRLNFISEITNKEVRAIPIDSWKELE